MPNALELLRSDHNEVKDLFKQFEQADDAATKGQIVQKTIRELQIHSKIEEEIFYPALRRQEDTDEADLDEAAEEHHVVDLIMDELLGMRPGSGRYDAKFTVLAENVKHHMEEEETELFPRAAERGQDGLEKMGARLEQRKMELQEEMAGGGSRRRTATRGSSTRGRTTAGRSTSRSRTGTRSTSTTSRRASTTRGSRSTGSRAAGTRSRTAAAGASKRTSGANGRTASSSTRGTGTKASGTRTAAMRTGPTSAGRTRTSSRNGGTERSSTRTARASTRPKSTGARSTGTGRRVSTAGRASGSSGGRARKSATTTRSRSR